MPSLSLRSTNGGQGNVLNRGAEHEQGLLLWASHFSHSKQSLQTQGEAVRHIAHAPSPLPLSGALAGSVSNAHAQHIYAQLPHPQEPQGGQCPSFGVLKQPEAPSLLQSPTQCSTTAVPAPRIPGSSPTAATSPSQPHDVALSLLPAGFHDAPALARVPAPTFHSHLAQTASAHPPISQDDLSRGSMRNHPHTTPVSDAILTATHCASPRASASPISQSQPEPVKGLRVGPGGEQRVEGPSNTAEQCTFSTAANSPGGGQEQGAELTSNAVEQCAAPTAAGSPGPPGSSAKWWLAAAVPAVLLGSAAAPLMVSVL